MLTRSNWRLVASLLLARITVVNSETRSWTFVADLEILLCHSLPLHPFGGHFYVDSEIQTDTTTLFNSALLSSSALGYVIHSSLRQRQRSREHHFKMEIRVIVITSRLFLLL